MHESASTCRQGSNGCSTCDIQWQADAGAKGTSLAVATYERGMSVTHCRLQTAECEWQVLQELGYSEEDIAGLRCRGVV